MAPACRFGLPSRNRRRLVMWFGVKPGPAPIPHLDRLKVLGAYYAWRRAGSN
jgi:hypothetical protein